MKGLPYMGHLASWEVGAAAPPPLLQPPQRRPGSAAARPSPGPATPEKMSVCCHLSITRWLNRLYSHISRGVSGYVGWAVCNPNYCSITSSSQNGHASVREEVCE